MMDQETDIYLGNDHDGSRNRYFVRKFVMDQETVIYLGNLWWIKKQLFISKLMMDPETDIYLGNS